jgi:integrase
MTWGDEQIEQYRKCHKIGTTARLALKLALNVAARRHDCHALGCQHLRNGRLTWKPYKTVRITGKQLSVKVTPEFAEALKAMAKSDGMAFLTTDYDKPFKSAAALGNKIADWCLAAGLKPVTCDDGKVRSYRMHGLRKAALTALAHDGATGPELLAVYGHSSLAQVEPYIQEANQARLADAAMAKSAAGRKRRAKVTKRSHPVTNGIQM